MSMSLILWKAPVTDDPDAARAWVEACYERGDDHAFEQSGDIALFADELRNRWPDDYSTERPPDCPWADMPFEQSDRLLALDLRWDADDQVIEVIHALAKKHELVIYDPQGPDIFLPSDPIPDSGEDPAPSFLQCVGAVSMAALLIALTYLAWLIPWWWLKWPVVTVAGFLACAAVFVVGCMIFGRGTSESPVRN